MTSEVPEDVAAALATPVGVAFKRLFTDPEFARRVADDPDAALADLGLDAEDAEALLSDAEALEGEVAGFASFRDPMAMINVLGGMRTPGRLGMNARILSWSGCLTCV